jgi:hypothetical protein
MEDISGQLLYLELLVYRTWLGLLYERAGMAVKLRKAIRLQVYCSHPSVLAKTEGSNIGENSTLSELLGRRETCGCQVKTDLHPILLSVIINVYWFEYLTV